MRVIDGKVPPGGWHFKQRLASSPQRPKTQLIQAPNYDQLLEMVFQFRLNNLDVVPTGTATREIVKSDIEYYLCGHFPGNCTGSKADLLRVANGESLPGRPKVDYKRPITRVEDWLTLLTQRNIVFVDQLKAHERAKICLKCPMNQAWRTGCGPCNANAARRSELIRGSHVTGLEQKLKHCLSFGTLLEVSVWLQEDYSAPRGGRQKPPDECWKMTENRK
jgi:hypothetical protein